MPALRGYARALTRNEAAADDLVQDALLRAYERAETYRPDRSLRSWLFAILHNLFVDGRRRGASEERGHAGLAGLWADRMAEAGQEHAVALAEIAARFDALPDEQRAVLDLVAVRGLTYQEAADALDAPIGTIMSRLSRARAALRAHMVSAKTEAGGTLRIIGGKDA
nr:sigma-70 family RNA polymerase sigma factor [Sphingomonas quercus]